jgi:hypothetical protein
MYIVLLAGCMAAGILSSSCALVGLAGTPTRREKIIEAEYALGERRDDMILVLVDQPGWISTEVNLRYHLTNRLNKELRKKIKLKPKHLVSYEKVSRFRSGEADFARHSPVEVGRALGARIVLVVTVEDHEFGQLSSSGYYNGFLTLNSALYEAGGKKLWPIPAQSKSIRVGFDVGIRSRAAAVERLMDAAAHCTVRYFYDCPKDQFQISDDKSDVSWQSWKNERMFGE